jgi:hypothetical protein
VRRRKKALDHQRFADASFTADESNAPVAGDGLTQLRLQDGHFKIAFEQYCYTITHCRATADRLPRKTYF